MADTAAAALTAPLTLIRGTTARPCLYFNHSNHQHGEIVEKAVGGFYTTETIAFSSK